MQIGQYLCNKICRNPPFSASESSVDDPEIVYLGSSHAEQADKYSIIAKLRTSLKITVVRECS